MWLFSSYVITSAIVTWFKANIFGDKELIFSQITQGRDRYSQQDANKSNFSERRDNKLVLFKIVLSFTLIDRGSL